MKLISHRGNINGENPERENSPDYLIEALQKGYDIEIDIWFIDDSWWLGHDNPTYKFNFYDFIEYNDKMWYHCKNLNALYKITDWNVKYFWHQNDDFTLTSNNIIWTYPGNQLTSNSICVLPEKNNYTDKELLSCYGICSDFIEKFYEKLLVN